VPERDKFLLLRVCMRPVIFLTPISTGELLANVGIAGAPKDPAPVVRLASLEDDFSVFAICLPEEGFALLSPPLEGEVRRDGEWRREEDETPGGREPKAEARGGRADTR
jgi:hypothetical protein